MNEPYDPNKDNFVEIKNLICPKCNEWIRLELNSVGLPALEYCYICKDELTFTDIHYQV